MRVLAMFAGGFSAAVFLSDYLIPKSLFLPIVALSILLAVFGRKMRGRRYELGTMTMLICAGLAIGFLWNTIYHMIFIDPSQSLDGQTVRLSGIATEYPRAGDNGFSVSVRVKTAGGPAITAVLYLDQQGEKIRPGDHIETVAYCELSSRGRGGEAITYYTANGVFLRAQAYGRLEIHSGEWIPPQYWPAVISQLLKTSIEQSFPKDVFPLMKALVTGDRHDLAVETTSSLRRAGLAHIVAVSGMHLAVLADVLALLLGRGKRSTAMAVIGFSVVFCGVAGNTPSVVRAAIMIAMLQLAPLFQRERDDITALLFALMLLLIWNPMSAAHVGLQFSFAAVAGILLIARPLQARFRKILEWNKIKRYQQLRPIRFLLYYGVEVLATTLGASAFTMLLSAIHFNTISLIAPLTNLMLVWMASFLLLGGFAVGIVGMLSSTAGLILAAPFVLPARIFLKAAEWFAKPALASIPLDVVYYRIWLIFICLLLAVHTLLPGRKRARYSLCAAVVVLAAAVMLTVQDFHRGSMLVSVLDVGQGQSVVVRVEEKVALVDCGGFDHENAGDTAADYLLARGVKHIDLLVLSHYDEDHINGVTQLMRRVALDRIVLPPMTEDDPLYDDFLLRLQTGDTQVEMIQEDVIVSIDKGKTITVYPPMVTRPKGNQKSLTVLATAGENDVLITGDMDQAVEERLLARRNLPDVELMVAGHHGSNDSNSERLLNRVKPEVVVISAGDQNRYGHPGQETLERFDRIGAEVYRTDQQGTVTVRFH